MYDETCARTVSSACVYDERIVAAGGASGSLGALFCASRAISVMRRRYVEEPSGPNDTAWNDTAFLCSQKRTRVSSNDVQWAKGNFYPSRTAVRHRSCTMLSPILHSPSERKMMTGNLYRCVSAVKKEVNEDMMLTFPCSSFAP